MDRQTISAPGRMSEEDAFATFTRSTVAMVLTNPTLEDNPIVYVNGAFERVTGYGRNSAIGRNCRFLQGPDTDPDHVAALRSAIAQEREFTADILNYRADGTSFTNRLMVSPVHDSQGDLSYFLGIQKVLTEEEARRARNRSADDMLREIQHRVKNHLAMIVGLIRIQSRAAAPSDPRAQYGTLARRVESLQLLYEELTLGDDASFGRDTVNLGSYLSRVATAIAHLDGRAGIAVSIDAAPVEAPVDVGTRLGLAVSEIMTNALQHAFVGRAEGRLTLRVARSPDGGVSVSVDDDGIGIPDGVDWPDMRSLGGRIVMGLVDGLSGRLNVRRGATGTTVTLDVEAAMLEK